MGTATSNQEEPESSNVKNDQSGDSKAPTEGELNEYKGDNDDKKEIVPIHGVQVRSFLGAPGVSYRFIFF